MRKHLYRLLAIDPPAVGGGGGTPPPAAGTPPPAEGTPPPAGGGTPNPQVGGTPPVGFDWKVLNLEADAQAAVDLHKWENPSAAVRSYVNLHKMTSLPPERLVKLPTDKSTPEEWNEFNTKIGVPAKAEDYKLPVPAGDKGEFATQAAKWMHEAGVPLSAANKLATKWNEAQAATKTAHETAIKQRNDTEVAELKTEWGVDYEKYEVMVDRAAVEFGMKKEHLDALKMVMGPKAAMNFLKNIGMKVGTEGEFISPDRADLGGFLDNMTSDQAKAQIEALKKDKAFQEMYVSKDPKTRQEARAKMDRLNRLAAPGTMSYPSAAR